MNLNKILPNGGAPRHGPNSTWTGNDNDVFKRLQ